MPRMQPASFSVGGTFFFAVTARRSDKGTGQSCLDSNLTTICPISQEC
jgi:hypothetical protein